MDPKVKEAQTWINSTYKSVPGYQPCPENGLVGWSTMYALVMGLQSELKISPVVAAFGPTTFTKLQALGNIGLDWTKNANIVRILQHGLFCKGYWGGDNYGTYDTKTYLAVNNLRTNMGLDGDRNLNGVVTPQLFRCILNMDAYVVLAGGTEKVRTIQQWLNGRYWQKANYTLGPCDGIYSRDVQKSLMIALQYELGISEPNGNFGPATQDGLRSRSLSIGATGIFVELFSAAAVFNEPVGVYTTNQRATYDQSLSDYIRAFQEFSLLPATGKGDYSTWAQLLVSMGDPDRVVTGCDTRFEITVSRAKWLRDKGYKSVGRYIYDPPGSTIDKEIKPGELDTIFAAGLRVMPIYQDNARQISDFTYSQGYRHALNAHALAKQYGFNRGTVIYFAVDYDATQEDIDTAIIPYFNGVQGGLNTNGKFYVHGVYGSRNVCINVSEKTFARYSFVSGMSWGFSGNLGFPLPVNWSFNQIKEMQVTNAADKFDLDNNVWRDGLGDSGQSSVSNLAGPADELVAYIARLYNCARDYGSGDPNMLVADFIRSEEYNDLGWKTLVGPVDLEFVSYAKQKGFTILKEFVDPFTGHTVGTEHLMAALYCHLKTPQPTNPKTVNSGDIGGWGGDLLTFYADWRSLADSYASGYTFCKERLMVPGIESSFKFEDITQDADGYLLAKKVRSGANIATAIKDYYIGTGGLKRFTDFYKARFTDAATCRLLARNMLTAANDDLVTLAQLRFFLGHIAPGALPSNKLDEFVNGFADVMLARTGSESFMTSQYESNHREFLQKSPMTSR